MKCQIREALLLLLVGSVVLNFLLVSQLHSLETIEGSSAGGKSIFSVLPENARHKLKSKAEPSNGRLQCAAYGGPSDEDAAEMMYWRTDIPADKQFKSVYGAEAEEKYFVFEPDESGFSNVRLSFETVVTLARAMGRTLVMLPTMRFAQLLHQHSEGVRSYALTDFFHISNVPMISMQEYLERVALQGRLRDQNGAVTFPPYNRTNWDGRVGNTGNSGRGEGDVLYNWISRSMPAIDWKRDFCIVPFPSNTASGIAAVRTYMGSILKEEARLHIEVQQRIKEYTGNPIPVNSSLRVRLREMLAERKELCEYNKTWAKAESIYLTGHEATGSRPLIPFYAYLFFQDWRQDLQMKRFARDNLRFSDIIQCTAARIVRAVREIAQQAAGGHNNGGSFDSMHVRRGDFKNLATYNESLDGAERIITDRYFTKFRTVYIATDEQDKTFFGPLHHHYNILFLQDFDHLLKGVDPNYYGMIEQLVCSRGDKFVGTLYSTFTSYVNRVRGYHAQKSQSPEALKGMLSSEYMGYGGSFRNIHHEYMSANRELWAREWPIGWRDIDHDVN
jgi:GDP-fucose protein O-fucosyltransferase